MNRESFSNYESVFKEYILGIIYILTGLYVLNCVFFYFTEYTLMWYFLFTALILNGLCIIIVHIIPYSYLIKLAKPVIFIMLSMYYPMVILHLCIGVVASLLWFIVVPMFVYIVLPEANIVRWLLWSGALLLLAMGAGYALWYFAHTEDIIPKTFYTYQMRVIIPSLLNTVAAFLFAAYSLLYINRFNRLKINDLDDPGMEPQDKANCPEHYKFEKIYGKIVRYIEDTKPYLNSNLKIGELSGILDINTAYINKAIFLYKNVNFNNFINSYRVDHAKKLIQGNLQYTLVYIYQSSGFKNQSSFNRIFKMLEGSTPSEYRISLLNRSESLKVILNDSDYKQPLASSF